MPLSAAPLKPSLPRRPTVSVAELPQTSCCTTTIFTLGIEGLGEDTPQGSGLLCLAIVGGAVVPVATGMVADHAGLSVALLAPALCYVWIAVYGFICRRPPVQA